METPPPLPADQRDWFSRNWKWFVPVAVVVAVACFAGFFALILGTLRHSEPYQQAVAAARASPAVVSALGTPLKDDFFVMGKIDTTTAGAGQAQFTIPITGPRGVGVIFAEASRAEGKWTFHTLAVQIPGRTEAIDLLAPSRAKP